MECTNEEPCGICDVCTLEEEIGACISNALYTNCESSKCKGCDHCNNCEHGEEINCCEICSPPAKCGHGVIYGDGCAACDEEDEEDDRQQMEMESPEYCKHDIELSECYECTAELDAAADRHREQQEWNHFHPAD